MNCRFRASAPPWRCPTTAQRAGKWARLTAPKTPAIAPVRDLLITQIRLDQAEVHYRATPGIEPALLEILHFEQARQDDDLLALNISGSLNGRPLEYAGTLGPFRNLVAGRDVRFEARGRAGSLEIEGSGMIDFLSEPQRPALNLRFSGASLTEFEQFLPGHALPDTPYRVHIDTTPAGERVAVSVSAASDGLQLELDGSSARLLDLTDISYRLNAGGDSLDRLGVMFGYDRLPPERFDLKGRLERKDAHLGLDKVELTIGAAFLELDGELEKFPWIGGATLKLQAHGPDISSFRDLIGIQGSAKGAFSAALELKRAPSGQSSFDASIETSILKATASGYPGPGPGLYRHRAVAHRLRPECRQHPGVLRLDFIPPGAFSLDAQLLVRDEEFEPGAGVTT